MAATLLLGDEVTDGNSTTTATQMWCVRWQAAASLDINRIRCWGTTTGAAKVGVYSDDSGDPDGEPLLTVNNSGTAIVADQWNQITVPAYTLSSGTYYWLAIITSPACVRLNTVFTGSDTRYTARSYGDGLPDFCPLSMSSDTYDIRFNGWNISSTVSLFFGGGI